MTNARWSRKVFANYDGIVSVSLPDVSSKPALTVFNSNGNTVKQINGKTNVIKLSVAGLTSGEEEHIINNRNGKQIRLKKYIVS